MSSAITVPESVPGRSHYSQKYFRGGRVFSYAHQIDSVLSFEPQSVLEVGVGAGVVAAALRAMGIAVTTFDIQSELAPDIVGSVIDIPCKTNSYDVGLCSQVLEHLPFTDFIPALRELGRVARRGLVLSLPDASPYYALRLRLPKLPHIAWTGARQRDPGQNWKATKWKSDGHYWEIGYDEVPLQRVLSALKSGGLEILQTWRVAENPYHRFFRLRTQPCNQR